MFLCLGLLLLARSVLGPSGHDEDQYLAAAEAVGRAAIFRDFVHLQTPVQAWLFNPIALFLQPNAFLALRVLTALLGVAALFFVYAAAREAGAGKLAAAAATALICTTEIFQFASGYVRNDILPTFLFAAALFAAARAIRRPGAGLWALCGILLALAVGAKVSFALPAAAVGLFLALSAGRRREGRDALLAFLGGGLAGALPTLVSAAMAPQSFLYGTLLHHAEASFEWYSVNQLEQAVSGSGKLLLFADALCSGPALAMLAIVAAARLLRSDAPRAPGTYLLFDLVLVAAIVAAALPTPTGPPYLVLILPPLAVQFALAAERLAGAVNSRLLRAGAMIWLAAGAALGLASTGRAARAAVEDGLPVRAMTLQAQWLGERLRACGVEGEVAGFTARWIVDSGYRLDLRFSPGVFVFRTGQLLAAAEAERLKVAVPQRLAADLDSRPPAAIVVGDEMGSPIFRIRPDMALVGYATARGWPRLDHPGGRMSVFMNPARIGGRCAPRS